MTPKKRNQAAWFLQKLHRLANYSSIHRAVEPHRSDSRALPKGYPRDTQGIAVIVVVVVVAVVVVVVAAVVVITRVPLRPGRPSASRRPGLGGDGVTGVFPSKLIPDGLPATNPNVGTKGCGMSWLLETQNG